jgi:hypothetical protein
MNYENMHNRQLVMKLELKDDFIKGMENELKDLKEKLRKANANIKLCLVTMRYS